MCYQNKKCSTDCCLTVITVDMQEDQNYVVMMEGFSNENGEYRLLTSATDGACALSYSYDWSCFEDCDQQCNSDITCFDDCGQEVMNHICYYCYVSEGS